MPIELRDYQNRILDDLRAAFKGRRSVCLQLETGGGKTAIAGKIAANLAKNTHERRTVALMLVHRRELVHQAWKTLDDFGLGKMTGIIAAGNPESPWAELQIASIPTLVNRLGKLPWCDPRLIIVDEAHHARDTTWERILMNWPNARVLGLTATPMRLDGKGLGNLFDYLVCGPSMGELTAAGYLAKCDVYSLPVGTDLQSVKKVAGEYSRKEQSAASGKVVAKTLDSWERIASDTRTIVYSATTADSEDFASRMRSRGYRAEHMDANTKPTMRTAIVNRFKTGATQILCNVEIVTEGFDVPECDCVLVRRKTASYGLWRQMIGRCLRPKKDGRKALVIDGAGNYDEHGGPGEDVEWTLDYGAGDGKSIKKKKPKPRVCSKCRFVYKRTINACPACGHVPENAVLDEVDVKLVRRDGRKPRQKAPRKRKAAAPAKVVNSRVFLTYGNRQQMEEIAAEYGYNPYVVRHWEKLFASAWERALARQDRIG